jgi:hypothetical protein
MLYERRRRKEFVAGHYNWEAGYAGKEPESVAIIVGEIDRADDGYSHQKK